MSFHDWIYSEYPADSAINGRYGPVHLGVIAFMVLLCVGICFLRNREEAKRRIVLYVLAGLIFLFEVARRVINLSRGDLSVPSLLYILLPRPWCAISCFLTMVTVLTRQKFLYNFTAMNSLLCSIVFFAYPTVGFFHNPLLFEDLYSISTHALLFISAVSMIALKFTDFRLNQGELLKTGALLLSVFCYAAVLILANIEPDPLMFLPGSQVQDFLGVSYGVFLIVYVGFLALWFSSFYLVQQWLLKGKSLVPQKAPITPAL